MSFQFFNPAKKITITHGDLPHWQQEGATYFITWRTQDSIPREVWQRWLSERETWLRHHRIDPAQPDWHAELERLPEEQRRDFRRFTRTLEVELDACHGSCPLRQPALAQIVQDSLHFRHGTAYTLGDHVIMPNHVHLIVGGLARGAMLKQIESWKKWTALEINRRLEQTGRLWQDESFDHLIRDETSFEKIRHYIAENPTRAHLQPGEFILQSSPHLAKRAEGNPQCATQAEQSTNPSPERPKSPPK
jgi:putative transposase